ncbi:hypothetical protein KPL70_024347 [Citrus sinensis]|nr:hypothetical protein KPL70_024347 [Citrus sinensis]
MNRAHRIGQSNRLLVYRLVVRASVEERILQLAKKNWRIGRDGQKTLASISQIENCMTFTITKHHVLLNTAPATLLGSQKEVEDILRWGTKELFNHSPSINGKDIGENNTNIEEAVRDLEQKHRKRGGGLGDVY